MSIRRIDTSASERMLEKSRFCQKDSLNLDESDEGETGGISSSVSISKRRKLLAERQQRRMNDLAPKSRVQSTIAASSTSSSVLSSLSSSSHSALSACQCKHQQFPSATSLLNKQPASSSRIEMILDNNNNTTTYNHPHHRHHIQERQLHTKEMSAKRRRAILTSQAILSWFIGFILIIGPSSSQAKRNADLERQLQLLRSANVELSRRSQRIQRDTSPPVLSDIQVTVPVQLPTQVQPPTCGYPGSPAHASVTFNSSQVVAGTVASYTCDNGYELLGPPRRLCQANGTWSPVGIPFCVLNVGLGKAAMQSSTAGHGSAQKAVDGSTSPYFQSSTCTMTDVENNPWWYVNLLEPYLVQIVRIDFGTACCANRQKATIAVRVGNNRPDLGNNPLCNRYHGFIEEGKPLFLPCTRPAPGAFVSIHLEAPSGSALSICETFIYTDHALSIEQCPSFRDQPLGSTATYNGKCYIFHNNQLLTFDGARKYCESRGGTLVDETSPALQGFLSWELYRRHRNDQLMGQYWLGAVKDQRNPQNWKWINGKDVQISFWSSLPGPASNCSRFDGSKGWLWSDSDCGMSLNFICQYRPLSCGKPEKPTNSTLITKNIDNGTVIEYQCAPGNLLMGPKARACLPTGFFSEFAPKCKYLDCQFPAMIANGDYKLLNGTTSYQSIVNYFCNEGFQIYGKATLTCDVDERWNGPPPRCEPLLCPAPVPPSNGFVTVTSNVTISGTQATYDCRPGYELVGDRLLTCAQSGSWDFNFPYCKERRVPIMLATPPTQPEREISSSKQPQRAPQSPVVPPAQPAASSTSSRPNIIGSVIFPTSRPSLAIASATPSSATTSSAFATTGSTSSLSGGTSTALTSTSSSPPATASLQTQPTDRNSLSPTSLPASLNGLVGQQQPQQFSVGQQLPTLQTPPASSVVDSQVPPAPVNDGSTRKAAQSTSVSQFASPPNGQPPQSAQPELILPPQLVIPNLQVAPSGSPAQQQASLQQQVQGTRIRTQQGATGSSSQQSLGATSNLQSQFSSSLSPMPSTSRGQQVVSSSNNKFQFDSPQMTTNSAFSSSSSSAPFAGSSIQPVMATTSGSGGNGNQFNSLSSSSSAPPASTTSLSGAGSSFSSQHSNVLASFNPTGIRAHNTLANAKYSLDGIIAVAIFGGFIFLGAIITIIVIIIRRKSSHSSSIDAQTISTYDSNGAEHNGLYRNYQQAWENLRFANPNSQPKSSGGGGGTQLMGAPLASAVGLKNFGTSVHGHPHTHIHHAHLLSGGHHNLGLTSETSESSASSAVGSSHADSTLGGNPAHLRHHHAHHPHHHAHQARSHGHRQRTSMSHQHHLHEHEHDHGVDVDEEDDEIMGEHGRVGGPVDHHYGGVALNSSEPLSGEGFRDSNELTINADTAPVPQQQQQLSLGASAGGRSRYSGAGNSSSSGLAASSGQRQRLVATTSSSSPSSSAHSSRDSPHSGDDELERLAYGNGWRNHQSGSGMQPQHQCAGSSSSNNHSAGSGASILGRASMRYS